MKMTKFIDEIREMEEVTSFRKNFYQFCENIIKYSTEVEVSEPIDEIDKPQSIEVKREVYSDYCHDGYTGDCTEISCSLEWYPHLPTQFIIRVSMKEPEEEPQIWSGHCNANEDKRIGFKVMLTTLKELGQEELLTDIDLLGVNND